MNPYLKEGQYVLLDKEYFHSNPIRRGDVIAFKSELTRGKYLIKRIIALPYEFVELKDSDILVNNELYKKVKKKSGSNFVNHLRLKLEEQQYFVLGDNLDNSFDSRKLGGIKITDILGLIWFRLWPPSLL
jgi:signal peptidase I